MKRSDPSDANADTVTDAAADAPADTAGSAHSSGRRRVLGGLAAGWVPLLAPALGIGAAGLGLPSVGAAQQKLVINTYGGRWEKFWRSELLPMLSKSTSIEPTLDVGLARTSSPTCGPPGSRSRPTVC